MVKLPRIECWWEMIESPRLWAVFAARSFADGPRPAVWRIVTSHDGRAWCHPREWRSTVTHMLIRHETRMRQDYGLQFYEQVRRAAVHGMPSIWDEPLAIPPAQSGGVDNGKVKS